MKTENTTTENTITTDTEIKSAVIRPGWLVSVNTTIKGGVSYERIPLDASGEVAEPGAVVTRWETKRTILDPAEHKLATETRSKARALITRVCQSTAFGDVCPEEQAGALSAAVNQARALVAAYNATSKHSEIGIFVLKGRVASTDAEAAQAITGEIADLVIQMKEGIEAVDADAIRKAASRAREISAMLDDSVKGKVEGAITQARKAAREITKRIEKGGEDKAIVLADIQRGQIESARIAFLDLSENTASIEAMPVVDAQRFADLDLDSEPSEPTPGPADRQAIPRLDLATGSESTPIVAPSQPDGITALAASWARMMELS